jgi:LysM repeat protein
MRSTILSLVRIIGVGVLIGLAAIVFSPARVAHAGGGCTSTYTVQRGDTLMKIASRFGVTYSELLFVNQGRIANPNLLFIGQVICLPEDFGAYEIISEELGAYKIALEARYTMIIQPEEKMLVGIIGNNQLGKRVEYPLQSIGALQVFSNTAFLKSALAADQVPILVGVRNNPVGVGAEDYTLVAVGRSDILTSLMISDTTTITPSTSSATPRPFSDVLKASLIKSTSLILWLEMEEGVRRPYLITRLDFVHNYQDFKAAYAKKPDGKACWEGNDREACIDFVLFSASAGHYSALLRLESRVDGPVNEGTSLRCSSWIGKGGGWYWFLRVANRCQRWR